MYLILIIIISTLITYVLIIHILRNNRLKYLKNIDDHQELVKQFFTMEFPFMWAKSMEIAIINTFPFKPVYVRLTINSKFKDNPEKRYDDSELIMREILEHGTNSCRGQKSVKRLNYIHNNFNIDNDSYLYVLALFVYVPIKMINEFGWRKLYDYEIEAISKTFINVGEEMNIKHLPNNYKEFENIIKNTYNKINNSLPDKRSKIIFESTLKMFLEPYPKCVHSLIKNILFSILEDPIKKGFAINDNYTITKRIVTFIFFIRKFIIKYLFPPRSKCCQDLRTSLKEDGKPRYGRYTKEKYCIGCPIKQVYHKGYNINELGKYKRIDGKKGIEIE
jgi:hypothetical protein